MQNLRTFAAFAAVSLASATFQARADQAPATDEPSVEELRQDIQDAKRELREDQRRLREQERAAIRAERSRLRPGPLWLHVGLNGSHVDQSEENCGGGQAGLSVGGPLFVRGQYAEVTWESDDDTDTCDGILGGDTRAIERSLLLGVALGKSGVNLAVGPAAVRMERSDVDQTLLKDTGTRYELAWNSRHALNSPVGVEVALFRNDNDIADFHGVAVNFLITPRVEGPRRRGKPAARAAGGNARY